MDVWTREWVDNGYHLGKVTLEGMQASWNRAKLEEADDGAEEMWGWFCDDMIDRLEIARQDDPNATIGYDIDEDVDGLRAAHPPEPCGQCDNGVCWTVERAMLKFYCFRVIVGVVDDDDDGDDYEEESWWPKWDMESCPFELADDDADPP
jgi:hypothetical protein